MRLSNLQSHVLHHLEKSGPMPSARVAFLIYGDSDPTCSQLTRVWSALCALRRRGRVYLSAAGQWTVAEESGVTIITDEEFPVWVWMKWVENRRKKGGK